MNKDTTHIKMDSAHIVINSAENPYGKTVIYDTADGTVYVGHCGWYTVNDNGRLEPAARPREPLPFDLECEILRLLPEWRAKLVLSRAPAADTG
jgi:hypothetical protein